MVRCVENGERGPKEKCRKAPARPEAARPKAVRPKAVKPVAATTLIWRLAATPTMLHCGLSEVMDILATAWLGRLLVV